jgi:hypothetical protein
MGTVGTASLFLAFGVQELFLARWIMETELTRRNALVLSGVAGATVVGLGAAGTAVASDGIAEGSRDDVLANLEVVRKEAMAVSADNFCAMWKSWIRRTMVLFQLLFPQYAKAIEEVIKIVDKYCEGK